MAAIRGGDRLEAALREISEKLRSAASVSVGFLEGATYPDGESVAQVAFWNEFGTKTAPPRPFFRNMVAAKSDEWPDAIAGLLRDNDYNTEVALEQTGAAIKGQLQQSIVDTMEPELSEITLMLRKMRAEDPDLVVTGATVGEAARRVAAGEPTTGVSTKPLVYSGHMLNSVDYEVKK